MEKEEFQLPRSSYVELVKIIQAYLSAGHDANLEKISQHAVMHQSAISRNNKFLMTAGIIQGGQKKSLTPLGEQLARDLEYDMPDKIEKAWRSIVGNSIFFGKVLSALRIRKGMDLEALRTHIAYTAGEKKSAPVMTGATAIIDILRASRLIKEENGKVVATISSESADRDITENENKRTTVEIESNEENPIFSRKLIRNGLQVILNINVQVNCPPEQLNELGSKLKAILDDLDGSAKESNTTGV